MAKRRAKSAPSRRRPERTPFEPAPLDFSPLMPFLHRRLGENHPISVAASSGYVAAFTAAIREEGDSQVEHDIAMELERVGTLSPRATPEPVQG